MNSWENTTLGNVIELKRGYDLPKRMRKPGTVPIVSSSGISDFHSVPKATGPGVVTGRYGTIGKVYFIEEDYWPLNTALYVRDFKGNDPRFIAYFLQTLDFFAYSDKAAVPGVNRNHLHTAEVLLPPFEEQKAIAVVLGAFDDKIELNRQMNATLEEMARAIFKSWFVDFDPVHAKARGEQPFGMDAETAALFPDRFDVVNGREVPAGWRNTSLGDELEFAYGKSLTAKNRTPGEFPVYGSNGPVGSHNEKLVDGPGIIVGRKGNPGTVNWSQKSFFPIDTTFYVVSKGSKQNLLFWFFILEFQNLPSLSADSAVPGLNRNIAYMNQVVLSAQELMARFEEIIEPIFAKVETNSDESKTLSKLRDTLLPRLMSGQLRVAGIEEG